MAPTAWKFQGCGMARDAAAKAIIPIKRRFLAFSHRSNLVRVMVFSFVQWNQVAKTERIALHVFTNCEMHGPPKNRTVENETVEFPVFPARVRAGWKIFQKLGVDFPARKIRGKDPQIHADHHGAKAQLQEGTDQFAGVPFPDGEDAVHTDLGEVVFPVGAQVLEKNIAENHFANASGEMHPQCFFHTRFVRRVDALRRDGHLMQRQPDGCGLPFEQLAAHAVHADPVKAFGDRGQQGGHAAALHGKHIVKRHRAVLSTTPAHQYGFLHRLTRGGRCTSPRRELPVRAPGSQSLPDTACRKDSRLWLSATLHATPHNSWRGRSARNPDYW